MWVRQLEIQNMKRYQYGVMDTPSANLTRPPPIILDDKAKIPRRAWIPLSYPRAPMITNLMANLLFHT